MGGVDGHIRIDTSVDSGSFNEGIKRVRASALQSFKSLMVGVGIVVGTGVRTVMNLVRSVLSAVRGLAVGVALVLLLGAGRIMTFMQDALGAARALTGSLGDNVRTLSGAFDGLRSALFGVFAQLLAAALPAILPIIHWFTELFNVISMVIAALRGQTTVMQYTVAAANGAAGATAKVAKNTKDMQKAAKGALAAFDQLNVLQQETAIETKPGETPGTGAGGGLSVSQKEVPITKEAAGIAAGILAEIAKLQLAWDNFKKGWDEFWKDPLGFTGEWLKNASVAEIILLSIVVALVLVGLWLGIVAVATAAWGAATLVVGVILGTVTAPIWLIVAAIAAVIAIILLLIKFWPQISEAAGKAWNWILAQLAIVIAGLQARWTQFTTWIKGIWNTASAWFMTTFIDPITKGFTTFLTNLKKTWETTFGGIRDFVKGIVNTIIDFVNAMIRAIASGINAVIGAINSIKVTIPNWVPVIGGKGWQLSIPKVAAPQIPRLAAGAVIPPNAQFAAILGDQRSGKNLEAPAAEFEKMLERAVASAGDRSVTINFTGPGSELVRLLKPKIDQENKRIGLSLIKGLT